MSLKLTHIGLAYLLLFLFSCQKSSNNSNNPSSTGSMALEIDGVAQTLTNYNNTLITVNQNSEIGRRMDLRANIGSELFILTVSNWDFQNPPNDGIVIKPYVTNFEYNGTLNNLPTDKTCVTRGNTTFCDGGLITHQVSSLDTRTSVRVPNEPSGRITITQNDPINKTVSGTFDGKVTNFQSNSQSVQMKGSFTNLSYTVLQ